MSLVSVSVLSSAYYTSQLPREGNFSTIGTRGATGSLKKRFLHRPEKPSFSGPETFF